MKGYALFSAGCAAFVAASAHAASGMDDFALSPEQLFNATVISASKTPEKVMDTPAAIYVLTGEDILRSGATSVPEALRLVPGVEVARVNANNWAIGIRGFNGTLDNKLLVLIDGRTLYDPLFSGVYWDIQDLVLEDIDRIEVIRGPGAALWGANAVNGVINIITRKAKDTQGNLVSATLGNQDGIAEERYGGELGDNGFYRAYVKYTDRNSEETLSGGSAHDAQDMDHGGFRADWNGTGDEKDGFTLEGDIYRSGESQIRIAPTMNLNPPPPPTFVSPFSQQELEDIDASGGNMLGRWTRSFSGDSKFILQSYADYTSRNQFFLKDQRGTFDVDAQYNLPAIGRHQLIVGGGYRYSIDGLTATPLATFTNIGDKTQLINGFFQDKITLAPKSWFLTLGSKLEHNTYSGIEFEPDARLQWQPDNRDMVWTSVSRAVRTPSRVEEDLNLVQAVAAGGTIDTVGNPDLGSEKLTAYELGYRRQWAPEINTDIAAFYNEYHALSTTTFDGFVTGSDPTRLVEQLAAMGNTWGESYGIETTVNWQAMKSLNISASHSLFEMALHNHTTGTLGAQSAETQSPKYEASLHAAWDIRKNLTYDTMLYYTSALAGYEVPSHTRLDMRLGWHITDGLEVNLVGQNLLDNRVHEFALPGTGVGVVAADINRAFYGQIVWHY